MKGLLLKDYIILKKQKFFLLLLVFYILLAPFAKTFAWYGLAILMSTFLSFSILGWF